MSIKSTEDVLAITKKYIIDYTCICIIWMLDIWGAGPRSRRVRLRSTILNNMEYIECITFSTIYMATYALSSALPIIFIKIRIRIVEGGNLKMWMKGVVCLPGRRL